MNEIVYDISNCNCIGRGGTKTVYSVSDDTVVFIPNFTDGPYLVEMWPRIVKEEFEMSELLQKINIPTLNFTPCKVKTHNYCISSYSSPSFKSYKNMGNYIIDLKSTKSTTWPHDNTLRLFSNDIDKNDLNIWVKILTPLLNDLDILCDNNLYLGNDTRNLVFVSKDSEWHSGSDLPFEVRLFCFDFASKNGPIDFTNRKPLKYFDVYHMLQKLIEYTVWEELAPTEFSLTSEQKELWRKILDLCKIKLKIYDSTITDEQLNNSTEIFCIIN